MWRQFCLRIICLLMTIHRYEWDIFYDARAPDLAWFANIHIVSWIQSVGDTRTQAKD